MKAHESGVEPNGNNLASSQNVRINLLLIFGSGDKLYDQALAIVARERKAATSYTQRRLEIGYNGAARLIERMEEEGVISGSAWRIIVGSLLPAAQLAAFGILIDQIRWNALHKSG